MTLKNPYTPGRAATGRQFYGRQTILQTLEHDDYRGAYIIGTRQIGKTSLLREMEQRLPAFYVDVSYLGSDLDRWVRNLQRTIAKKQAAYPWLPDTTTTTGFFALLEQIAQAAEDQQQPLWLLLDEAEDLMALAEANPGFLSRLRGAAEMLPALRLVLAGYRSLLELRQAAPPYYPSPLLGGFVAFILPPLSENEAIALIRQEQTPVQVEKATLDKILIQAGGHPFLLQRLGNYLWTEGALPSPDETIQYRIRADANNVFPADFELLTDSEQQILLGLCRREETTFAEIESLIELKNVHLAHILQDLVELGFLRRTTNAYAISNQILSNWLASLESSESSAEIPPPLSSESVAVELHPAAEQERQLKKRLKIHQDNLAHYQEIKARYGFDVPLPVINGLKYEEDAIQKLQQNLEDLSQTGYS